MDGQSVGFKYRTWNVMGKNGSRGTYLPRAKERSLQERGGERGRRRRFIRHAPVIMAAVLSDALV